MMTLGFRNSDYMDILAHSPKSANETTGNY